MKANRVVHALLVIGLLFGPFGLLCHAQAPGRGGSNFAWYQFDTATCVGWPYGVIKNYDTATTAINNVLQTMYNNGQRRLRIPIYYDHGAPSTDGTTLDSTGGNLSPQNRTNLTNLLATIKAIGYSEIEVGMFPLGSNDPIGWTSWNETTYQENWNLLANLHSIIANSGIFYRIDLQNEGQPTTGQTVLQQYASRIWGDYTSGTFGWTDTVGSSIAGDSAARMQLLPNVYGTYPHSPALYDLHFYNDPGGSFQNMHNYTPSGWGRGWIIGETFYNNSNSAYWFQTEMNALPQTVYYVAQWPLDSSGPCQPICCNVVPLSFSNYITYGF